MKKGILIAGISALCLLPEISSAHSFGKLYNLPVPFWMYVYGGVGAMVVSFLFIGYFFDKKKVGHSYPTFDLSQFRFFRYAASSGVQLTAKIFSVALFLLTILTGFFGENNSYSNFSMTFFWIIFVLGMTYMTALVGDIFKFINPWKTLTDLLIKKDEAPILNYPKRFGYYPALFFYIAFIWIELLGHTTPLRLSVILLIYSIITDIGVVFFGSRIWFTYCEFFSVFFRLISKIAPLEYKSGKLYLRVPLVGLLQERAEHFSLLVFILFMLSSTAFDGLRETIPYSRLYWGHLDDMLRPIFGTFSYPLFETVGLLLALLIFLSIYMSLIHLARKIAASSISSTDLALRFAFSLIPIALVYNIAHYYTLIFSQGFGAINLISDPFGFGWNVFGTANYSSAVIVGANFVWHSEVAFILIGHIVSVYLAHVIALDIFHTDQNSKKRAFWSQLPMLIMMIFYTILGLWILSAPLTAA